jgi:hypothetical protein
LGHWPESIHDHILVASVFPAYDSVVSVWLRFIFYLPVVWLALASLFAGVRVIRWREFLVGLCCWTPFLFALIIDPRGLVWWFID